MKRIIFLTAFFLLALSLPAQQSFSQQLNSFSPLAHVYLKHLGLADKNRNGVIDKGADEGYEAFTAQYGNADVGFYANGVTYGVTNGKLEEPEIINHYYINIRFKPEFEKETTAIESEVKAFVYANRLPLVWMDDQRGTVMNAVNKILGEGWQKQPMTVSQAEEKFTKVMKELQLQSLPSSPVASGIGYRQLPDVIATKKCYCFEVVQFYFLLFSEVKMRTVDVETLLPSGLLHGVVKLLDNNKIIDYFGSGTKYRIPADQWTIRNPLQSLSDYYIVQAGTKKTSNITGYFEQAVIYDKYNIGTISPLLEYYSNSNNPNHREIIAIGEYFFKNTDIPHLMNSTDLNMPEIKNNIKVTLALLVKNYSATRDYNGYDNAVYLLNQYFRNETNIQDFIDYYRF